MKTRYYWKELTDDGRLIEPVAVFPNEEELDMNINTLGGFDSECSAIIELDDLYPYEPPKRLVLITVYEP